MSHPKPHRIGTAISWKWLGRLIEGHIKDVYVEPVSKVLKGKTIKRNGSSENPAYLVESVAGNQALKLHSELAETKSKKMTAKKTPKMFQ